MAGQPFDNYSVDNSILGGTGNNQFPQNQKYDSRSNSNHIYLHQSLTLPIHLKMLVNSGMLKIELS